MKLPEQVIEVKEKLLKARDPRIGIMKALTETDDIAYQSDVEKMWKSLLKAEMANGRALSNQWVLEYLDAVQIFMQEKSYFSLSGEVRRKHMAEIRDYTKKLKIAYKKLGLDEPFLLLDPVTFPLLDEEGNAVTETDLHPTFGIINALDFYHDYAIEELRNYKPKGKAGGRQKSNRFVRSLGTRFMNGYKTPLLETIARAAFLLYGEEYSESEVLYLVKGRK